YPDPERSAPGVLSSLARGEQADGRRVGAEVFVLDMGEPVRILDLARAMIELSGLDPDRDIEIEIVGRRPGEKLNEELFNGYERAVPTGAEKIMRAERDPLAAAAVESMFDEIGLLVLEGDAAGLARKVAELSAAQLQAPAPVARRLSQPVPQSVPRGMAQPIRQQPAQPAAQAKPVQAAQPAPAARAMPAVPSGAYPSGHTRAGTGGQAAGASAAAASTGAAAASLAG